MFDWKGKGLSIGDLHVKAPIVQGGMGIGISGHRLAAAVAKEGGIGVISAVGLEYLGKSLTEEIRKARALTEGALGVNIMVAASEYMKLAKTAVKEGADVIFAGAGLPLRLPEALFPDSKTKLVPIVSSAKAAALIARRWMSVYGYAPDAFVLEGPKAGGHLGFSLAQIEAPEYQLKRLLEPMKETVCAIAEKAGKRIPIIAAGGVFTGEDIFELLKQGADGVQMATRFVATEECDADIAFKKAYVDCKKEDIGIIQSPVGMPGRALKNSFLKEAEAGLRHPRSCLRHCITACKRRQAPYCISSALIQACRGRLDEGFAFIGANGYRIEKITTVRELFEELGEGFCRAQEMGGERI